MSRSYKLRPFKSKLKAHRIDRDTKTTLRNKMWKLIETDPKIREGDMTLFTKFSFLSMIVILLLTSFVSKKMLIQEHARSKICYIDLNDCKQPYRVVVMQNKDLSNDILQLENQLGDEQNRCVMLDHFFELLEPPAS